MKNILDLFLSIFFLLFLSPIISLALILVWSQDFKNPLYISKRVGKYGLEFNMIKIRSMVVGADKTGVDSTSNDDARITLVGRFIRKMKIDEISQIVNVMSGKMSFVGPRPNVKRETDLYTDEEKKLLRIRPGITDFSSIIFSDEGDILKDSPNPDLRYNQVIRPWKSRLGLFYIDKQTLFLDIWIIILTGLNVFHRKLALKLVSKTLFKLNADSMLVEIALRNSNLKPMAPPGALNIVESR